MTLNLTPLQPDPAPDSDRSRWATVTGIGPIRIKLDGESTPLPFTPTTLLNDLIVGDRVLVMLMTSPDRLRRARRVVILGKGQLTTTLILPPIGVVWDYAGATAPTGWAICDGSALSRTTEAPLFAVLGTTYGVGDGSTTFNIPNTKGRVVVGKDAGDGQFDTLGETGGAKTHTLVTGEMPVHTHPQVVTAAIGGSGVRTDYDTDAASTAFDQGVSTLGAGGGGAHNNLQPYIVMNQIIRVR
jgi:microcystin-dependent protein